MIQKSSLIKPFDTSGITKTNVFHVYKKLGKIAYTGDFLKVSAREINPECVFKKKSKHISILIKTIFKNKRLDSSFIKFKQNGLVILKKRLTPKGTNVKGPASINIKRKKFVASFPRNI